MKNKIPMSYYRSLPKKRMGSGVIIRNAKGEILILKTIYKKHWEIPGGVIEGNESPKKTAERETLEELGIRLKINLCLVIHYRSAQGGQDENIMFVFDGGILPSKKIFKIDKKEISETQFVSFKGASLLVGKRIASRLPYCEQALRRKKTIYLESIKSINPTAFS
jgi:8-oxo-dGTP diphosphatase